jgi:hypothetical protein
VSASRATASIAATHTAEAKKKKRKGTRLKVPAGTTTVSSDVDAINIDDEEGDVESTRATAASSVGTPRMEASPVK